MTALSIVSRNSEPRIRDIDLADRLGFPDVAKFRRLIRRHAKYLEKISALLTIDVASDPHSRGGRRTTCYFLTEAQLVFMTFKAGTPAAIQAVAEIAREFDQIPFFIRDAERLVFTPRGECPHA